ncbi:MAG: diacylglycerol kinase family lipid kinase, partial [Senegalimassilia anaerobia]|nr:diacylglycerol kinase family lipid kinase [Senegalimassilia anaerobia]
MNSSLGHILLVANPAAQSGAGAAAAERAAANLRTALGEDAVTVARTAGP